MDLTLSLQSPDLGVLLLNDAVFVHSTLLRTLMERLAASRFLTQAFLGRNARYYLQRFVDVKFLEWFV